MLQSRAGTATCTVHAACPMVCKVLDQATSRLHLLLVSATELQGWPAVKSIVLLSSTLACCLQLIFGGAGHQGPLNDLWIFNTLSRQWTAVESNGMPPMPREMHSGTMADDSRMIVFGGRGTEQQVIMDKQSQCCSRGPRRVRLCASLWCLSTPASACRCFQMSAYSMLTA